MLHAITSSPSTATPHTLNIEQLDRECDFYWGILFHTYIYARTVYSWQSI